MEDLEARWDPEPTTHLICDLGQLLRVDVFIVGHICHFADRLLDVSHQLLHLCDAVADITLKRALKNLALMLVRS